MAAEAECGGGRASCNGEIRKEMNNSLIPFSCQMIYFAIFEIVFQPLNTEL